MSKRSKLRMLYRQLRSRVQAVVFATQGALGVRGPSRTCQIPDLPTHLKNGLGNIERGSFVEVGAYDGERFSNTSWLADRGWNGVYVEPSPEYATLCRARHRLNRVQVVNCAAGVEEGEAVLMQMGSLSTISAPTFMAYQEQDWSKRQLEKRLEEHTAKIRPLDAILESTKVEPGFDLLVVDVEGFEEQVFQGFDLPRWSPRMMIVELCDVHSDLNTKAELSESAARVRKQILSCGYEELYRDEINTIFVRSEKTRALAA